MSDVKLRSSTIVGTPFAAKALFCEDVAFQNPDGSIVLFALNSGSAPGTFSVSWKGTYFNYTLPAQSVVTFEWK